MQLGYSGRLISVARGIITTMLPRFSDSGPPTLEISGQDSLVKLRDRKPGPKDRKRFVKESDIEIAQIVAVRTTPKFKGPDELGKKTNVHDVVVQKDQDEAKFLKERAAASIVIATSRSTQRAEKRHWSSKNLRMEGTAARSRCTSSSGARALSTSLPN